jgi:uncharacterized protein YdeI (YjbR/CyaY-like superfamily)
MKIYKDLEVLEFQNYETLDKWLSINYDREKGIWLRVFKVNSGISSVSNKEFVIAGLCWGWIDGLINSCDDISYLIRFTPRGTKSIWSKINVNSVNQLIKDGKMMPSGMAQVAAAKNDGRWDRAYEPPSKMVADPILLLELENYPKAKSNFSKLSKQDLYSINFQIATIKKENKIKKILSIIKKLEDN